MLHAVKGFLCNHIAALLKLELQLQLHVQLKLEIQLQLHVQLKLASILHFFTETTAKTM